MSYTYVDYPPRGSCYPPMWSPVVSPHNPPPPPHYPATPVRPMPSIAEQMGTDPVSKLAAAIEKLADAIIAERPVR